MSESNSIRMGDPYTLDHSTDFWIIRNAYYCEDYSILFSYSKFLSLPSPGLPEAVSNYIC